MRSRLLLCATILLCLSTIHLRVTDKLSLYIHPRYILFTLTLCTIGLIFLTISWFSDSHRKPAKTDILVFIIALTSIVLPPVSLSQQIASNRSQNQVSSRETTVISSFDAFSQDLSRFELADWVSFFSTNPSEAQVVGKSAKVTGFIYTDQTGQRFIGRFRINCCAVDATPLGIRLSESSKTSELSEGAWYTVSGFFESTDSESQPEFSLAITTTESTNEPEFPYVY